VCLSTLGPGATNLVTAAAYAQLGAMPMLMITGQKPIKSSKQGRFQIIDVVDMMQPLTKYTAQVVSGDRVPSSCARPVAWRTRSARAPCTSSCRRISPPKRPARS
jgi:thiamine pyrophosphate-dependent acetolactate synthase large subunit-like protein